MDIASLSAQASPASQPPVDLSVTVRPSTAPTSAPASSNDRPPQNPAAQDLGSIISGLVIALDSGDTAAALQDVAAYVLQAGQSSGLLLSAYA